MLPSGTPCLAYLSYPEPQRPFATFWYTVSLLSVLSRAVTAICYPLVHPLPICLVLSLDDHLLPIGTLSLASPCPSLVPSIESFAFFEGSPSHSHQVMSSADITTKKNCRKGFRGYVTQRSKAIDTLISDFEQRHQAAAAAPSTSNVADDDFTKTVGLVLASLKQIEARWASEDKVNREIASLITDEDRLLEELAEQENYKDERVVITDKVAAFVHRGSTTTPSVQVTLPSTVFVNRHNAVPATSTYREPTLKPFYGDIYDWPSWWELYEANVHSLNIPTRIKFAELERYIQGEAAKVIEGVSRTEAHYATAIQLLQEAYGDNKHRVEKLIDDLIDLPVVRDQSNVRALRGLLDGIKINVRMLNTMGRPQSSYSEDLLRRLVVKMPRDFAVAWNESPSADSGSIDNLIKFLEVKVKSRERCDRY